MFPLWVIRSPSFASLIGSVFASIWGSSFIFFAFATRRGGGSRSGRVPLIAFHRNAVLSLPSSSPYLINFVAAFFIKTLRRRIFANLCSCCCHGFWPFAHVVSVFTSSSFFLPFFVASLAPRVAFAVAFSVSNNL